MPNPRELIHADPDRMVTLRRGRSPESEERSWQVEVAMRSGDGFAVDKVVLSESELRHIVETIEELGRSERDAIE